MKLLKSYLTSTDLYVVGSGMSKTKGDEELCVLITDDYCSGIVKGNKNTDFWIETEGCMMILTKEQFDEGILEYEDIESSEEMGVVEFKGFTGDVYVRLIDKGVDCLKEDPDLDEDLVDQYKEGLSNGWGDVELLFSGDYISSIKKEIKDYYVTR